MKLVSGLLRLVGITFLYGLLSTMVLEPIRARNERKRRRVLEGGLTFSVAKFVQRKVLSRVVRTGWGQMYLPRNTEDVQEHIDDCKSLLVEVAPDLKVTLSELRECAEMFDVHETDEWALGKDKPYIPTSEMPRSKADRIAWLRTWKPPDRETEIRNNNEFFIANRGPIERWIENNVREAARPKWFRLVESFHQVQGRVAKVVFEIHALQKGKMAVILASLDEDDPWWLDPEAAEAWLRSASELITMKPISYRLEFYRDMLLEAVRPEVVPVTLQARTAS